MTDLLAVDLRTLLEAVGAVSLAIGFYALGYERACAEHMRITNAFAAKRLRAHAAFKETHERTMRETEGLL